MKYKSLCGEIMEIREITPEADQHLAAIIRYNFEKHNLNIPGTVYFDPELDHLSEFYLARPDCRRYFVLWEDGRVCGGIGFAEFAGFDHCAEIQKLYLSENMKGRGYGKALLSLAETEAKKLGYKMVYVETHTNFNVAYQMYCRHGYRHIEKPAIVSHGAMNRFLIKPL